MGNEESTCLEHVNVIVVGKTGCGKSTLINAVFKEELAKTGIGEPITDKITCYTKPESEYSIYDSPGIQIDPKQPKRLKNDIINLIREKYKTKDINNFIHCIWYCFDAESRRIDFIEKDFVNSLSKKISSMSYNIPIIFVITKSYDDYIGKIFKKFLKNMKEKKEIIFDDVIRIVAEDKVFKIAKHNKTYCSHGVDILIEKTNEIIDNIFPLSKRLKATEVLKQPNRTGIDNQKKTKEIKQMNILTVEEIDDLVIVESIGNGSQSDVFKVGQQKYFALKVLKLKSDHQSNENFISFKRFFQEYEIINNLDHPNIIKAYGFCFGDETHAPSILLEFFPYSLKNIVKEMNDIEKAIAIYELCLSMREVHKNNIIHRDLKPENIFFDENKHLKLSDFGISWISSISEQTTSKTAGIGTLKFMAPEILLEKTDYNEKVDVYSFGVVMFYILTGGFLPEITIVGIAKGEKAKIPDYINQLSRNLINNCWSYTADERPSFDEITDLIEKQKFNLIDGLKPHLSEIKSFLNSK